MGRQLELIIVRRPRCNKEGDEPEVDLLPERVMNVLEQDEEYLRYVKKHGYHFTEALAEHVSKMMVNADGTKHTWAAAQVKKALENLELHIPTTVTDGDITYLANMYYADLHPEPLKDEVSCLKAAYKSAKDPDGYEGMAFCRWTADVIAKSISINWENFT